MKNLFKTKNKACKQTEIQNGMTSSPPGSRHCLRRHLISVFIETKAQNSAGEEMAGDRKEKKKGARFGKDKAEVVKGRAMRTKEGTGNRKKQGRKANIPKKSRIRKRRKRKREKEKRKKDGTGCKTPGS